MMARLWNAFARRAGEHTLDPAAAFYGPPSAANSPTGGAAGHGDMLIPAAARNPETGLLRSVAHPDRAVLIPPRSRQLLLAA